jgi:hypothetical protein
MLASPGTNKPEDLILAIVEFLDEEPSHHMHYLGNPFHREPDFGASSVRSNFADLSTPAEAPR